MRRFYNKIIKEYYANPKIISLNIISKFLHICKKYLKPA